MICQLQPEITIRSHELALASFFASFSGPGFADRTGSDGQLISPAAGGLSSEQRNKAKNIRRTSVAGRRKATDAARFIIMYCRGGASMGSKRISRRVAVTMKAAQVALSICQCSRAIKQIHS